MKKIFTITSIFAFILLLGIRCSKESTDVASLAGGATGTGGSMARFTIVGNYLYTVDKQKLTIFSIANPGDPVLKNSIQVGFEIETIFPFKNRLFIGSTSVIHIFNIDNPEQPVKLSTAISPTVMRRCDPVVAKDTVAYATLRTNGACGGTQSILATYDIRNIENPVQTSFRVISEPYGLGYADTTLYVCDRFGLNIFNITQPYQPAFRRNVSNSEWFFDVIPQGNSLICWVKSGLIVFDITNKTNPVLVKKIT